jgi:casein kinase 1
MDGTIGELIGRGAFGDVYAGTYKGERVAIKQATSDKSQLRREYLVYSRLRDGSAAPPAVGIPAVHWFGLVETRPTMVMDIMGPCVEDLFDYCNRVFSVKTVLLLADQIISCLEFVHSRRVLHRDIKPTNFVMGVPPRAHQVFLVDFGVATKSTPVYSEDMSFVGTVRYASINTHLGVRSSRRDDMESVGYMLVYFLAGRLPWQNVHAPTKDSKRAIVLSRKLHSGLAHENVPTPILRYIKYCRELFFEDTPQYNKLRRRLRRCAADRKIVYDNRFDWM